MRNCVAHTSIGDRRVRKECDQWILCAIMLPQRSENSILVDLTTKSTIELID